MRIIGGKFRGRKINPPSGLDVRPTTDFAKEALFNILNNQDMVDGADVLELFSGTGNVTFEFISQGARHITAVEKDPKKTAFIKKFADTLNVDNLTVIKQDVQRYLETENETYDIIFADPPFDLPWLTRIPEIIKMNSLLNAGGWLIVEHGPKTAFDNTEGFLQKRTYGNINFSIFS